jgi:transcription termination factor Rho
MRGFVSGVFWGLLASAAVLIVAALQVGPPGAEVEAAEPALAPTAEPTEAEGAVIVTTDPEPAVDAAPAAEDDVAVGIDPDTGAPGAEPDPASGPGAAEVEAALEAPEEPAAPGDEPVEAAIETVPATGEAATAGGQEASDQDAAEQEADTREDGTVVIRQTVPVAPPDD